MQTVGQLEPASSDIAIGILPLHPLMIQFSEATISYVYTKLSWYVPCPNQVQRWKSIYKIFGFVVWACFSIDVILVVIVMWLLAHYEKQINVVESEN